MHSKIAIVRVLSLFILLLQCSCKDNPVEETIVVAVAGNLLNSNFQATILRAELIFDGQTIGSENFSQAAGNATISGSLTSVKKGSHTIAFKITSQTSSPNTYETICANVGAGGSHYNLADQRKSLATGESITFTVNL